MAIKAMMSSNKPHGQQQQQSGLMGMASSFLGSGSSNSNSASHNSGSGSSSGLAGLAGSLLGGSHNKPQTQAQTTSSSSSSGLGGMVGGLLGGHNSVSLMDDWERMLKLTWRYVAKPAAATAKLWILFKRAQSGRHVHRTSTSNFVLRISALDA